jgi:hypothetical protein
MPMSHNIFIATRRKEVIMTKVLEVLKKIQAFLAGKKTYIVMAVAVVVNGAYVLGYIGLEEVELLNSVLVLLGLGTVRLAISGK